MRLLGRIIGAVIVLALVAVIGLLLLSWIHPETASKEVSDVLSAVQSGAQAVLDQGKIVGDEGKKALDSAKGILPDALDKAKEGVGGVVDDAIDGVKEKVTDVTGYKNGSKITANQAKALLDAGGVVVLDVRTQEEYDEGHIMNAKLLPVDDIGEDVTGALPDKDAIILVYCRTGMRSANAVKKLVALGYTHVYEIGTYADWPYEKG